MYSGRSDGFLDRFDGQVWIPLPVVALVVRVDGGGILQA
jgi:hypothetical protein